jgi:hypothetical protein
MIARGLIGVAGSAVLLLAGSGSVPILHGVVTHVDGAVRSRVRGMRPSR